MGRVDEILVGVSDVGTAGPSEGSSKEELDNVFEDRLEGIREGESESMSGSGSDGESANRSVGVGRGVCAGVGSCGSVQTGSPSATYQTSLCLFNSFKGLHTKTQEHQKDEHS